MYVSHKSVRLLLEDVAKSLADKAQSGYGRQSEFNQLENRRYPFIWILPLRGGRQFISNNTTKTKTWDVAIMFYDPDEADADAKESASILDTMDVLVDRYMHALDDWFERSDDTLGSLTLNNDRQIALYKDNSEIETGWLLEFQMIVSDDFFYCTPENVDLYAGNI